MIINILITAMPSARQDYFFIVGIRICFHKVPDVQYLHICEVMFDIFDIDYTRSQQRLGICRKCSDIRVVCAPDFGSRCPGYESR